MIAVMRFDTFGGKRAAVRSFRRVFSEMRAKMVEAFALGGFEGAEYNAVSMTIPRDDYECCEWYMSHLKQWISDIDPETQELLPTGK